MLRPAAEWHMLRIDDGSPFPLGATWDGRGVNFSIFSAHATSVDLCLFDPAGRRETARISLPQQTDEIWHGYVTGIGPGQLYGYRVHGPYEPRHGHRFNPHKLLIDPYARFLHGQIRWHDSLYGYRSGPHRNDLAPDRRDSSGMVPKCMVIDPSYPWDDDRHPRRSWTDTIIYEAHVKGLTILHPDIPAPVRGTFEALGHPAIVDHLVRLGITAVELMPIHGFVDDRFLVDKGLRNYWGYSPVAFFAPETRYLGETGIVGLKTAIRTLHEAGIEVILDVVYNHTAESDHLGPTLCFRGIDNAVYYKLGHDPQLYWDVTGTGNTLNLDHPRVLQMVLDSLRYWVEVYHVDGFRFDLASALAREPHEFSHRAGILRAIAQDPVLNRVKLIAEPWDLGHGGYRVGQFPIGWSEWNDQFRDTVRAFWRGDLDQLPKFTRAMTGSREIYGWSKRTPSASVNYVCSHDGFTLQDLVSYNDRHNQANGEANRDGHPHNLSFNWGIEGTTDDPEVVATRSRMKRSLLATVLFSQGVPMVLMGDEISRSQQGNNNAYAQDNETSWLDWQASKEQDPDLLDFVRTLVGLRRRFAAFRRRTFLTGAPVASDVLRDVYWLAPEGREMSQKDWADADRLTFGMQLGNDAPDGNRLLLLLNAADHRVRFQLPKDLASRRWIQTFDTSLADGLVRGHRSVLKPGGTFHIEAKSLVLFEHE